MLTFDDVSKLLPSDVITALTVDGEGRGEPIEGIIAIACVIRNRKFSTEKFSKFNDYTSVCLSPKQFSCWNVSDANLLRLLDLGTKCYNKEEIKDPVFNEILYLVRGVIYEEILDNTFGSLYYMTLALAETKDKTKWKNKNVKGSQVFYSL